MEPALGRRLSRLALSLWFAPPALVLVAVWGELAWGPTYYAFVAVTVVVLLIVSLMRVDGRRQQ